MRDAAERSDIGECHRAIIAKESRAWTLGWIGKRRAVWNEEIEVIIVVVVNERQTAAFDFENLR